jgi:hypothetical protein
MENDSEGMAQFLLSPDFNVTVVLKSYNSSGVVPLSIFAK